MRQNSKNNRSRGRGGRKGPNPLTRSYESNGPDVKVRGTAQHVAEKYMTLARDALSSGDTIAAENYFQHAEHYNRIIMSAQAQANAAREEERRNQAAHAAENMEQPRTDMRSDARSEDEQPAVVNGSAEEPEKSESSANGADVVADNDDGAAAEKPKPRARRGTGRGRGRPSGEKAAAQSSEGENASAGDSIADNPPAFLMSE